MSNDAILHNDVTSLSISCKPCILQCCIQYIGLNLLDSEWACSSHLFNFFLLKYLYFFINCLNLLVWEFWKYIFRSSQVGCQKEFLHLTFCIIFLLEVNSSHSLVLYFTCPAWMLFISYWREIFKDGKICQYLFTSDFTFFMISFIDARISVVHFCKFFALLQKCLPLLLLLLLLYV